MRAPLSLGPALRGERKPSLPLPQQSVWVGHLCSKHQFYKLLQLSSLVITNSVTTSDRAKKSKTRRSRKIILTDQQETEHQKKKQSSKSGQHLGRTTVLWNKNVESKLISWPSLLLVGVEYHSHRLKLLWKSDQNVHKTRQETGSCILEMSISGTLFWRLGSLDICKSN